MGALLEHHRKVLEALAEAGNYDGDRAYLCFASIMNRTGLDRSIVRRTCRHLDRKGYTEFGKGLWSDEGPYGAGYRITDAGVAVIDERNA